MSGQLKITILGEDIPVQYEIISIDKLVYLKENPRVISAVQSIDSSQTEDEIQKNIHALMVEQTSVVNVKKRIIANEGLQEPILVRFDRMAVVEGNSRLAAFRLLYAKSKDEKWACIPCHVVTRLTDNQQFAYLNSVHVEGKTPWTAYEKANMVYLESLKGKTPDQIAGLIGISTRETKTKIKVIDMMHKAGDNKQKHFSYYDVLVRNRKISPAIQENDELKKLILNGIKTEEFEAADLRDKLPAILNKKMVLKKYMKKALDLDEAYQIAKPSEVSKKVKEAINKIDTISKSDIKKINEKNAINSLLQDTKNLARLSSRLKKMTEEIKGEFDNAHV